MVKQIKSAFFTIFMATVVLGLQYGDEGKGKIVDLLSKDFKYICRFNGGNNAGHTLNIDDKTFKFHMIPSGLIHPNTIGIIGNGCVVDLEDLFNEIDLLEKAGIEIKSRLKISHKAHLVRKIHKEKDTSDLSKKIGTTGKGIGPCYTDKVARTGTQIEKLFGNLTYGFYEHTQDLDQLSRKYQRILYENKMIIDCSETLNGIDPSQILIEGANATLLDIDHGTYPYVTSSNCSIGGVFTGLGISHKKVETVWGVFKAYTTRVGNGPFESEIFGETCDLLQQKGNEIGTTTGRTRRCGWLNLDELKYACTINGVDKLVMTKIDVLAGFKEVFIHSGKNTISFKGWEQVTDDSAKTFIKYIEDYLKIPICIIGTGPERNEYIKWNN